MEREETLLRALGDVGDDLVEMAGNYRVTAGWKRWGAVAASLALVICLTALALPYLPMGCSSADKSSPEANAPISPDPDRWNGVYDSADEDIFTESTQMPSSAPSDDAAETPQTGLTVQDAVAAMDMQYLTETVVEPLIRWQVSTFSSAADLSEEDLERVYLAVMKLEEPWRDVSVATVGDIRKKLSQRLEGVHIYAPMNRKLPIDGALKELPQIEPQFLHVSGQTVRLEVLVDGHYMTFTVVLDGDDWRYVSVQ